MVDYLCPCPAPLTCCSTCLSQLICPRIGQHELSTLMVHRNWGWTDQCQEETGFGKPWEPARPIPLTSQHCALVARMGHTRWVGWGTCQTSSPSSPFPSSSTSSSCSLETAHSNWLPLVVVSVIQVPVLRWLSPPPFMPAVGELTEEIGDCHLCQHHRWPAY